MKSGDHYSRGKFLISAEYLVLHGSKALAVPLKFGQRMMVSELPEPGIIKWETFVRDERWFNSVFRLKNFEILESSRAETALFIQNLLKAGSELQPTLLSSSKGYLIQNFIDFDISWGLGSSSSLLSNIAYWLDIDPYSLFRKLFHGSGYDVYCSRAGNPITYQLVNGRPDFREVIFNPSFSDGLYFIYLGQKQDSQASVKKFLEKPSVAEGIIKDISAITERMIRAESLDEFSGLMRKHEEILSSVLGLPMVKDQLFPDFPGDIKSLGAWGGDFVLAASKMAPIEVKDYFRRKSLEVVFSWEEIVL